MLYLSVKLQDFTRICLVTKQRAQSFLSPFVSRSAGLLIGGVNCGGWIGLVSWFLCVLTTYPLKRASRIHVKEKQELQVRLLVRLRQSRLA